MKNESYEEYMNRKLEKSVQYKTHYETVEELTMEKYYNYEVEEQEEPKDKELPTGIVVLMIFSYVVFFGGIVFVLYELINGGI